MELPAIIGIATRRPGERSRAFPLCVALDFCWVCASPLFRFDRARQWLAESLWLSRMHHLTAIPVFNEGRHIGGVLGEVLRYARDVLVVDDGSTDDTPRRLEEFAQVRVVRHPRNLGYGAALATAFDAAIAQGYEGMVTLDCDGQHEPALIPRLVERLVEADIVSGSRYLKTFDPNQRPPEERRRINVEVTRWLNDCLGFNLTDAFCGFKAYRTSALRHFSITELGYAMPIQVWVQAAAHGLSVVEEPVPLVYLDESRAFGGALDNAAFRLAHYRRVFEAAVESAGFLAPDGCRG
jgi:glycosyltransferase involved in cell wall biosynthesis